MQSIELAEQLFRTLLQEGRPTDARVISFRSFLVNQYPEGHKIAVKVEKEPSESTARIPGTKSNGKQMQKFVHPSVGTPLQRRRPTVAVPNERRSKFKETVEPDTEELGLSPNAAVNPLSTLTQKPEPLTVQKEPDQQGNVAVHAGDESLKPLTDADIERYKTMTRSEIADELEHSERLIAYMKQKGIQFNPKANLKQLAGTLLQHLKSK